MQKVTREALIKRACELLADGTVDRVLGWKAGEFDYDVTPALFHSAEELERDFVFGDFCGANFSKYLVKETGKSDRKVLVFLKPCDTYSFNQLLNEHRFDREKAYAIGIPCEGMLEANGIRQVAEGISSVPKEKPSKWRLFTTALFPLTALPFCPIGAPTANPKSMWPMTS